MTNKCSCCSDLSFAECCGPILDGKKEAETAEQLMRARYSAFAHQRLPFIFETHHPETVAEIDRNETERWAKDSEWTKLEVLETDKGKKKDTEGQVTFKAHYTFKGAEKIHHEIALFKKLDGRWFFYNGMAPAKVPVRREEKAGRNDPCTCGSGKKFKKCCGA